jgi:hypothetical protein
MRVMTVLNREEIKERVCIDVVNFLLGQVRSLPQHTREQQHSADAVRAQLDTLSESALAELSETLLAAVRQGALCNAGRSLEFLPKIAELLLPAERITVDVDGTCRPCAQHAP